MAISVTNVNEAPTITSAATASFAENATGTVYTVAATDQDAGAHADLFTRRGPMRPGSTSTPRQARSRSNHRPIMKPQPMLAPTISMTSRYVLPMALSRLPRPWPSPSQTSTRRQHVTSAATANYAENGTGTVYTATATDPDAGTTLTYSISGADASLFNINATTGAVTFKSSPNFEVRADAGANNVYDITVGASDGTNITTKAVAVTVTNVNEAPTITSAPVQVLPRMQRGRFILSPQQILMPEQR